MTSKLKPNFTQIPNTILDELLSVLSESELKVLLYICRRTYGFHKQSDRISTSQLMNGIRDKDGVHLDTGTGLSNKSILDSIKSLEKLGIIKTIQKGTQTKYFSLDTAYEKSTQEAKDLLMKNLHKPYVKSTQVLMKNLHIQNKEKESIQNKDVVTRKSGDPMTLNEFIELCRKSPQKHIQIIAEWAEGEQPRHTTYGEWQAFVKRNLRPAKELAPYPIEKIEKAYQKMQEDVVRKLPNGKTVGFITKYSLETVIKYIDLV